MSNLPYGSICETTDDQCCCGNYCALASGQSSGGTGVCQSDDGRVTGGGGRFPRGLRPSLGEGRPQMKTGTGAMGGTPPYGGGEQVGEDTTSAMIPRNFGVDSEGTPITNTTHDLVKAGAGGCRTCGLCHPNNCFNCGCDTCGYECGDSGASFVPKSRRVGKTPHPPYAGVGKEVKTYSTEEDDPNYSEFTPSGYANFTMPVFKQPIVPALVMGMVIGVGLFASYQLTKTLKV